MITRLTDVPQNLIAFRATGKATKDDYESVVFPSVKELLQDTGKLNYLVTVHTPLKNFTASVWREDMSHDPKEITKWQHIAIHTHSHTLKNFRDAFSVIVHDEFKGLIIEQEQDDEAVK